MDARLLPLEDGVQLRTNTACQYDIVATVSFYSPLKVGAGDTPFILEHPSHFASSR
jgi:hypothetical protein